MKVVISIISISNSMYVLHTNSLTHQTYFDVCMSVTNYKKINNMCIYDLFI